MASKHEGLMTFYKQVLASVDLQVDDDGLIAFAPAGGEIIPAAIDGKRWILPTQSALNTRGIWDECIAFHPLSENFLNGESVVLAKLKAAINLKLGITTAELMAWLVKYAADPEKQNAGNVSVKASKYLKLVPDIKEITAERIEEIIERSAASSDRRFVNLYLKKGGDILDSRYSWVCTATFPFRTELDGEQPKVFGVTISKKDQKSFKALFDYILPDNDLIETYSAGSKVRSACKFDAVLRSFAKIATRLNEVISSHRKLLPTYKDLLINLDWLETLDQVDKLADVVPPLPHNEGESSRERRTEGAAKVSTAVAAKAQRTFGGGSKTATKPQLEKRETIRPQAAEIVDEPRFDRPQLVEVRQSDEVQPEESFHERMARLKQQSNASRTGYQGGGYQGGTVGLGRRDYAATAQEHVPDWARNEGKSFMVAGQDPREANQPGNRFYHGAVQGQAVPAFSERFSNRRGGGGSYGGNMGGGGRFQL